MLAGVVPNCLSETVTSGIVRSLWLLLASMSMIAAIFVPVLLNTHT